MAPDDVTQLLLAWRGGDKAAFDRLLPLVYDELRRLAHHYMLDERRGHLLQTTALVHEAYVRMVGLERDWEGRRHFFAAAATPAPGPRARTKTAHPMNRRKE